MLDRLIRGASAIESVQCVYLTGLFVYSKRDYHNVIRVGDGGAGGHVEVHGCCSYPDSTCSRAKQLPSCVVFLSDFAWFEYFFIFCTP